MNLLTRVKNASIYPLALAIVSTQSAVSRVKSWGKKPIIHFEQPYTGQKILLLALYEKGELRPDIVNLLQVAKKQDLYIIAVNTLTLVKPNELRESINCYIERPNFGRDFGSYQTGFLHIFKQGWEKQCPRLLMINDSLFYSKSHLTQFIQNLTETDIEVLSATENHEIEHHLGSFCISISKSVIKNNKFIEYWKNYKKTDIRPKVIQRGEMNLSKILRSCVISPSNYSAYFDLCWLNQEISKNPKILIDLHQYYRTKSYYQEPNFIDWRRPSMKSALDRFSKKYIHIKPEIDISYAKYNINIDTQLAYFADNPFNFIGALKNIFTDFDTQNAEEKILQEIKNDLLECFSSGSQIHQNNIILHHLGLPIIKLDGLYRGMFSIEDIQKLSSQLDCNERIYFQKLMYSKPFGGSNLYGWKRAAFYRGLI